MIFKEDTGTGYMYCYAPSHPAANKAGKVLEHVFVMSTHIGRQLTKFECVHHEDRNRKNNQLSNLRLMTRTSHAELHMKLKLEELGVKPKELQNLVCSNCKKNYTTKDSSSSYCSEDCAHKGARKFNQTKEELADLVWRMPTTEVAKLLGVSDVAVAKRCKLLGVEKPPRGYWLASNFQELRKLRLAQTKPPLA